MAMRQARESTFAHHIGSCTRLPRRCIAQRTIPTIRNSAHKKLGSNCNLQRTPGWPGPVGICQAVRPRPPAPSPMKITEALRRISCRDLQAQRHIEPYKKGAHDGRPPTIEGRRRGRTPILALISYSSAALIERVAFPSIFKGPLESWSAAIRQVGRSGDAAHARAIRASA